MRKLMLAITLASLPLTPARAFDMLDFLAQSQQEATRRNFDIARQPSPYSQLPEPAPFVYPRLYEPLQALQDLQRAQDERIERRQALPPGAPFSMNGATY